MRAWALAAALGTVATPAAAADQFDLICKGRQKTSIDGSWKPYEQSYKVDLTSKTYCTFKCELVESIASVDDARIAFQKTDEADAGAVTVFHYVNRSDGKWTYFFSGGSGSYENTEGVCEPAPFTGFPAAKF